MHKICNNCGAINSEHARFCGKCGSPSRSNESVGTRFGERVPADQAAEIIQKTKVRAEELRAETKHIWSNFTVGEKIVAGGAIAMLVSFLFPWASIPGQSINGVSAGQSTWYVYLMPISAVISLVLLYFSQGAAGKNKILVARWQIVIGMFWTTAVLVSIVFIEAIVEAIKNSIGSLGALLGAASGMGIEIGIGLYLAILGAAAIVVGAFKLQKELLE